MPFPPQQAQAGDFATIRLDAVRVTDDGQKQMITGHTTIFRDGQEIARMYPAKWYFREARGPADHCSRDSANVRGSSIS